MLHGDIAKVTDDGGTKVCWEAFDGADAQGHPVRDGWHCTTLVLSKGETAQAAVQQERERVAAEAAAKSKVEADKAKAVEPVKPAEATKSVQPAKTMVVPVKGKP